MIAPTMSLGTRILRREGEGERRTYWNHFANMREKRKSSRRKEGGRSELIIIKVAVNPNDIEAPNHPIHTTRQKLLSQRKTLLHTR